MFSCQRVHDYLSVINTQAIKSHTLLILKAMYRVAFDIVVVVSLPLRKVFLKFLHYHFEIGIG